MKMSTPTPNRLTRQERAFIRKFVRESRDKNSRSTRDYNELQGRNAKTLGTDGRNASVYYLQDAGAGLVSVKQILGERRHLKGGV